MRVATACLAVLALAPFAAADEKPSLVLEVTVPKAVYPDEPIAVKTAIRNTGKTDAYVVRVIDGSFDGLRSVVSYRWIVKKGGERVPRRTDVFRIDNYVNALDDADVLLLKPGKAVEPWVGGFGSFENYHDLRVPGKYTVALSYELNPAGSEKGSQKALQLIQKQPAVLIESKPVEVTVLPFPPAVAAAEDKMKTADARAQIVRKFALMVEANANSTAQERDAAAERLKRAEAALEEATAAHAAKFAEFQKKRAEDRKKK
jgi:hypothetical protein